MPSAGQEACATKDGEDAEQIDLWHDLFWEYGTLLVAHIKDRMDTAVGDKKRSQPSCFLLPWRETLAPGRN